MYWLYRILTVIVSAAGVIIVGRTIGYLAMLGITLMILGAMSSVLGWKRMFKNPVES